MRKIEISYFMLFIFGFSLSMSISCMGKEDAMSEREILEKLSQLKPLPKVHYSFNLPFELLKNKESQKLFQFCRIAHSLSVDCEHSTEEHVFNCVYICQEINKTKPDIPSSIGLKMSPFHNVFPKGTPPTDRGPFYKREMDLLADSLSRIKRFLEKSNKRLNSNIEVTAVLLDTEVFYAKENDPNWNNSLCELHDSITINVRKVFPEARVEWYSRGVQVAASNDGWKKSSYFTWKEIKTPLSCALYVLPEIERMREVFRRTSRLADELEINDVTPWVSLASGLRRKLKKFQVYDYDWDYDIIYSYIMGTELNQNWYAERPKWFAPYSRAKVIVFFPPAFYPQTPHWCRHFIAYVRGATGVRDISDLENIE